MQAVSLDYRSSFIDNKATPATGSHLNVAVRHAGKSQVRSRGLLYSLLKRRFVRKLHARQMSEIIRIEQHFIKLGFIGSKHRFTSVECSRSRVQISDKQNVIFSTISLSS